MPAPVFANAAALHANKAVDANKIVQTDAALRDLWVGHAFWVRAVVAETLVGNTAAAAAAETEAVGNARQIAAAMEPVYGTAAAEKLFGLLGGHYGAVGRAADRDLQPFYLPENERRIGVDARP